MLIDISPEIREGIAVFPGDVPFVQTIALDMNRGDHLTLSSMNGTLHLGSHADAPSHYLHGGESIADRSLDFYIGPCDVIDVTAVGARRIGPNDLPLDRDWAERVLFRTDTFLDPSRWSDSFASLSPELIDHLSGRGVRLVGIDTPSIDPSESKELESHQAVARHDMAILEGLILSRVEAGRYRLIAPPLRIHGGDAGPVRAVLETIG
ncbi:MAG: cyclase family protein [Thermoanaerobaculia bacterium]|nr:cyclase family protein [Thermoanaerobaculia bacterium]